MPDSQPSHDVAVIGGGAAGLSAALVLARARRRTVVIDAGEPRNAPAAATHGFLSRDGLPPAELLALGRAEVASYGGRLLADRAIAIQRVDGGFTVTLDGGEVLTARRVLVTTGLHDVLPDIPGVRERWGRDLLHCPYCHGHEVRDQRLGVLGGGAQAVTHALLVRQWSPDVVFFSGDEPLDDGAREMLRARDIEVVEGARLVVEDDRLTGVALADGRVIGRDAVFVRPDFVPHADLLVGLACATDEHGWVVADATGRTSQPVVLVPRLFGAPLGTIRLFAPDLGLALIASAAGGVLWAVFRLVVAYSLRSAED